MGIMVFELMQHLMSRARWRKDCNAHDLLRNSNAQRRQRWWILKVLLRRKETILPTPWQSMLHHILLPAIAGPISRVHVFFFLTWIKCSDYFSLSTCFITEINFYDISSHFFFRHFPSRVFQSILLNSEGD